MSEAQAAAQPLSAQQLKQKSVAGAVSYFGRTIFLMVVNLVAMVILTAKLKPEEFGIYGIVIQFVGLLVFVSDVGLAAALVQKKDEPTRDELKTAFTVQQGLSWVIVAISLIVVWLGLLSQKTGEVGNWILLALAISFPLTGLKTIPSILLERKLDYSKLVLPQIAETLVFNGVLVWLVLADRGVVAYAYAIIFRSIVGVLLMLFIQPWKPGLGIKRETWHLFKFGLAFQANDLLARIKDQFYYLALGYVLPLNQFGYIQWAKNWSMYPYNLTVQNVMSITFPTFSRLQHDPRLLSRAIEKTLYFITLGIFPLLMGMMIFIAPLIQVFPQYSKWQPAVLALVLFCFSIIWGSISTPMTNVLNAIGKINITLKLMVLWTILTWTLTPLFLYWYGYNGVAWAAAAVGLTSALPIWIVHRLVPFRFWDQIWRQLIGMVAMGLIGWYGSVYWSQSIQLLLVGMMLGGLTYVLVTVVLGPQKCYHELKSLLARAQ